MRNFVSEELCGRESYPRDSVRLKISEIEEGYSTVHGDAYPPNGTWPLLITAPQSPGYGVYGKFQPGSRTKVFRSTLCNLAPGATTDLTAADNHAASHERSEEK